MKRIITFSLLAIMATVIFAGCSKRDHYRDNDDSDYWYSQEKGDVIFSSDICEYFVVKLSDTYAIMQSFTSSADYPYPGDFLYGNFNNTGSTRDYFNDAQEDYFEDGYIMRARIVEFEPNENTAILKAQNNYCGGVAKSLQPRIRTKIK